tara:strand:+ start:788 stop:991 length:204 start_codon:yes stop_codon:yes gene_type:complete
MHHQDDAIGKTGIQHCLDAFEEVVATCLHRTYCIRAVDDNVLTVANTLMQMFKRIRKMTPVPVTPTT